MKSILRFLATALAAILFGSSGLEAENVVIDWNNIGSTTIVTNVKQSSALSGVWFAYVHLAVYDAVNAIDHRHQPYLFATDAPDGASKDAAAVAAAHLVLANYFPAQQATLDAQSSSSLAALSDTPANISARVAVGQQTAQRLITARFHIRFLSNLPSTPPPAPRSPLRPPPACAATT